MFTRFSQTYKGILLALAGYASFAVGDTTSKYLVQFYSIYQIIGLNCLLASLIMVILIPVLKEDKPLFDTQKPWLHFIKCMATLLIGYLNVLALSHLPMAVFYTVIFVKPLWAAILTALFYGDNGRVYNWVAIAAGFCGVVVAINPGVESFNPWMLLPLVAALCSATGFVVSRSMPTASIFSLGFYPVTMTAVVSFPLLLSVFEMPSLFHWLLFVVNAAGMVGGIAIVSLAFRAVPGYVAAPFQYSQIIYGTVFGFLIFGDVVQVQTVLGAVIIIGSGLFLIYQQSRKDTVS